MISSSSGSCHIASLSWQGPEEELNKLLLMKVSDRDRNVKGKNVGCVKLISNLWFNTVFQSSDVYESLDIRLYLGPYWDMYLTTLLSIVVGFILLLRHRA